MCERRSFGGLVAVCAGVLLASAGGVRAASVVDVGVHELFAGLPGQKVSLIVSGTDRVEGLNLHVQVADGGSSTAPKLTAIDIVGPGTIFAGNNLGQTTVVGSPQTRSAFTLTFTGDVAADGLLATLTIDTTGFPEGASYPLLLTGTLAGDTDFAGDPVEVRNGRIVLVAIPEPAAIGLLAPCAPLLRRRRARV